MSNVLPVSIEEEMKRSYLEYAMSVIVGRALPDVRDGLKPVQRRILYAMYEMGLGPDKPYRKSARIVGEVLGKYHPHGDMAVYEALVRMAQGFTLRYPLIDGQGNFGSVDGDPPAAMRYTEARLTPIALELLADIEKGTVDFTPNFDGSMEEPVVLPSRIPNLLINGASGIAVGMATNIPPHNLGEVIRACLALLENPGLRVEELMKYIPGPDFPTGGIIVGQEGIKNAYLTGKGILQIKGKARIEKAKDRHRIVIYELPYQVNKAQLVQKIAELAEEKKVEGIMEVRDESDREGIRVVVEVKKDQDPKKVLDVLYKLTPLQSSFGVILLALVGGQPMLLDLKRILELFLEHRKEVIRRRSRHDLQEAEKKAHILEGFLKALDRIDEIISLIRASETPKEAKEGLIKKFGFTELQAQAILDMKLQRLTGLERDKIAEEFEQVSKKILWLKEILSSEEKLKDELARELKEVSELYSDRRRTTIEDALPKEVEEEVPDEPVVVLLTSSDYIKVTPLDHYKNQGRGSKGKVAISLKEGDWLKGVLVASMRDFVLVFDNEGKVYSIRVSELPVLPPNAKGKHLSTLLRLEQGEKVAALAVVKDFSKGDVLMVTRQGVIKKTSLEEFKNIRSSGIKALSLKKDDQLVGVDIVESQELLIATRGGYATLISPAEIRTMGRTAQGVRGLRLKKGDEVVSAVKLEGGTHLLFVTEKGYGKRVKLEEFKLQKRGGQGVIALRLTEKSGRLVGVLCVSDEDEVLLSSSKGRVLRIRAKLIPQQGRYSTGARLMRLETDETIAGVASLGAVVVK